ncbi:MAG: CCA tRNA nucleotidyltransferase [Pirellulales bacterium]|nr:CCA tRNA nucleotidyltransferase [Pirellulales bacterium]
MLKIVPEEQRRFAVEVVRRLRRAGFEAYWAGGCVRDQLLGRTPADYDVATDAEPEQVRELFGRRRTLAIGAAFGVITVRGPRGAGMIEVATFRRDSEYSDGRHPDSVSFSSAAEDASRRDFTINGLFYDPIEERVIDFVDGRRDIAVRVVRAIGSARERFAEDKLRMLRAVRFAAAFDFALDEEARAAIAEMAGEIRAVSPERIAVEMRRLLADVNRASAVRLLLDTGLAAAILPEIVPGDEEQRQRFDGTLAWLDRLGEDCGFAAAMAALLANRVDSDGAAEIGRRWRLSNDERQRICRLIEHRDALLTADSMRWSKLQPLLISEGIGDLLRLTETASAKGMEAAAHCRKLLEQPRELLDPPPLLTGDDLLARGIPPGPRYKTILQRIRDAQLDGEIETFEEAIGIVESGEWRVESEG